MRTIKILTFIMSLCLVLVIGACGNEDVNVVKDKNDKIQVVHLLNYLRIS